MSEIKHTMPDVIYAGFESNAVHEMFPIWYSRAYKNSTSYTRTDIVQAWVEALKAANAVLQCMGIDEKHAIAGEQAALIQQALNKAKGVGDE